jgi:vesicle-fusing ATPase
VPLVIRPASLVLGPELAGIVRLIDREVALLGALPILDVGDEPDGGAAAVLLDLLEAPVVVATGGSGGRSPDRLVVRRSVGLPDPAEQRSLWSAWLGPRLSGDVEIVVEEISQHFRLGARSVAGVARELAMADLGGVAVATTLRRLCRERARVHLDGLAQRIEPQATWDDLVLPAGHLELLHDIARHARHRTQVYERWGFAERETRGLGVTALFAGESGTGKTLAAEVLAAELGLDLYRIDLSATVSKYIGETEKNIRRLFDAAEASGAVLLFDEADALFGKRGEVKDGHDRYANLEVAYLLQRMESYRGLAILTTNMRSHIDRAFLRRLRFVIQFPFPDRAQRADIWRRVFPAAAPLDGIDPDELARMTVPGGSIRSIALSAAFAAAEDGTSVTVDHIMRAARVEYAKSERSLTDAEAGGTR